MRSISVILMMMIWTSLQTIKLCMWKLALCWVNRRNFRLPNYRDWKCCRVTGHQSPASGAAASYLFHIRNGPVSINQPKGELCIWLVPKNKRTPFMMCSATQQRKRGSISIPGYTLRYMYHILAHLFLYLFCKFIKTKWRTSILTCVTIIFDTWILIGYIINYETKCS